MRVPDGEVAIGIEDTERWEYGQPRRRTRSNWSWHEEGKGRWEVTREGGSATILVVVEDVAARDEGAVDLFEDEVLFLLLCRHSWVNEY